MIGTGLGCLVSLGAYAILEGEKLPVQVRFQDAERLVAIQPDSFMIEPINTKGGTSVFTENMIAKDGRLDLRLPEGQYRMSVIEPGYGSMSTDFQIKKGSPADFRFQLQPNEMPEPLRTETIQKKLNKHTFLAQGYVINDHTGEPEQGAMISNGNEQVITDEEGFFSLQIPVKNSNGYADLAIKSENLGFYQLKNAQIWPGGDSTYRIALSKTPVYRDLLEERRNHEVMDTSDCDSCGDPAIKTDTPTPRGGTPGPLLPEVIRVGTNCPSATTCTTVEVVTMYNYVRRVVTSEWYACWGNVPGGLNSLKAGTVAVRSYAISYAYSPRTTTYDLCNTTSCQVYGTSTSSNVDTATTETANYVLSTATNGVYRSEYSAENNSAACGNGFAGTGTTGAPCIADPVCTGQALFGHGRGLCQWGSARWATGKNLTSAQACTTAAPNHAFGTKDWVQILSHYYPNNALVLGTTAALTGVTRTPNNPTPGTAVSVGATLTATDAITNTFFRATLTNGTNVYTRTNTRSNVPAGTSNPSASVSLLSVAPVGTYSVAAFLNFDRDNSNTFNTGDFQIASGAGTNLVVIPASTITVNAAQGQIGASVPISAALFKAGVASPGKSLSFSVGGVGIGSATTDTNGIASLNWTVSAGTLGSSPLSVSFSGDTTQGPATGSSTFTRVSPVTAVAFSANAAPGTQAAVPIRVTLPNGDPAPGAAITLTCGLPASPILGTTNANGLATILVPVPATQAPGIVPYSITIGTNNGYLPTTASARIVVTRRSN